MALNISGDYNAEKDASPVSPAVETGPPVAGHVSKLRGRWPGFSLEVHQDPSSFAASKNASNAPRAKPGWPSTKFVTGWVGITIKSYL